MSDQEEFERMGQSLNDLASIAATSVSIRISHIITKVSRTFTTAERRRAFTLTSLRYVTVIADEVTDRWRSQIIKRHAPPPPPTGETN